MTGKLPTVGAASFTCPHCKAIAHQTWFECYARTFDKDASPDVVREADIEDRLKPFPAGEKENFRRYLMELASGPVSVYALSEGKWVGHGTQNLWISRCYSCEKHALWIHERLVWPVSTLSAPPAQVDLPDDVKADYEEAARIVDLSPRGAAALLRLSIQKLCKHVGESGKDLNGDIGKLVAKGLSKKVQQALDIVRVIGNEAVHPGQIDLKDDRTTATELFELVNIISDEMIGRPKRLDEMYANLPAGKRKQIEERDGKKPQP